MTKTTNATKMIITKAEINDYIHTAHETEDPKVLMQLTKRSVYGVEDDPKDRLHGFLIQAILFNDNTPEKALDTIYKHFPSVRNRTRIARHKNTSKELLHDLANDPDVSVRVEALKNINIAKSDLEDAIYNHKEGVAALATYHDQRMHDQMHLYSPDEPKNILYFLHDLVFRLGMQNVADDLSDYIDQME